jgi:methylated-DNA-[protein]-cysteine S-methyltransferase
MTKAHVSTVDTQIGPFTAIIASDGAVLASGWTASADELLALISPSLRPDEIHSRPDLGEVTGAVRDYHRGDLSAIDRIPVRQISGPFITHAWEVLRTIPPGKPTSYTDFAALAGRPEAVRAAASACARNAATLFVPCHRILRNDRTLGGFRWGRPAKQWLLAHESGIQNPVP